MSRPDFAHAGPVGQNLACKPDRAALRALRCTRLARALPFVFVLLVGGCSSSDNSRSGLLEPYRVNLPQGNYVTREMLDQVKEGLTRDQVRFALGSPLLTHLFHADRWDYVFRYQHASGKAELRRVVIKFKEDKVAAIESDPLPQRDDLSDPALPGYKPQAAVKN